ncbi:MAG: YbdK family carboxylate-amine ligase [Solirubrobacterales bacterium]|nr:YbdK family carboxylate-amine ligase [Solirubrobacterales bacterium]
MSADEHRFGSGTPFSIGVEEELFLVDPVTGTQANASGAVIERLERNGGSGDEQGPGDGQVERELHACQVELITGVHSSAADAVRELSRLRRAVLATGAGLLGSGTHPTASEGDAEITDKERYERIHFLLGDAALTPVAGLHIHVGMPDGDTAIRVFNGLRRDLPLLQALAANSPFRHGRDTGLASAREVTLRGWPRSGAPRAMRDYDDFVAMTDRLVRAADVPDYTWFWWKLRPHPRLGTVEIRALDAQTRPEDTVALVALVHCLARDAAHAGGAEDPPPEVIEEGIFRAARFGVHGRLPDAEGTLRAVSDVLDDAVARASRWAGELGCSDELDGLRDLVARGGGAGAQREVYEIAGIDAVARRLVEPTRLGA